MTPEQWIRDELIQLWSDLDTAQRNAINGDWSIQCDGIGQRIKEASELVGPVDYADIGMTHLITGWFAAMNRRIGIVDPKLPTDEEIAGYIEMQHQSDRRLRGLA
ncbi:hypothetical protein [Mycolicibacterium sphagni]|uniref:hypothetical protein n=1 Tax=Mycolicibacterium sphagni TaxID=1786 RepID=UPI0021F386B5|nr:hypothetical protein [Mycolicibacterium sphagni]MCV7174773.1 hypothetical protein [Mycolicibacterium sphagni]